jgi:hypothetical protein
MLVVPTRFLFSKALPGIVSDPTLQLTLSGEGTSGLDEGQPGLRDASVRLAAGKQILPSSVS